MVILMCPSWFTSDLLCCCLFLQGAFPTPWTFGKILRNPLCSWGFPFQFYLSNVSQRRLCISHQIFWPWFRRFPKDASKMLLNLLNVSAQSGFVYTIQSPWGSLILSPGYRNTAASLAAFCQSLACPLVTYDIRGSEALGEDWFATASDVPVILLPDFCSHYLLTEKGMMGYLTFYPAGFILYPSFLIPWGGEN